MIELTIRQGEKYSFVVVVVVEKMICTFWSILDTFITPFTGFSLRFEEVKLLRNSDL